MSTGETSTEAALADRARPGLTDRAWTPPVALALTLLSMFFVGLGHGLDYYATLGSRLETFDPAILLQGFIYMGALVAILGTHEMGHWLVARAHGVRTSLPIFIPMPFGIGTFGAVIAMKDLPPTRSALLRIGAAGPLAGGVVALVLMAIALPLCPVIEHATVATEGAAYMELGDSLGTWLIQSAFRGSVPDGSDVLATPLFFAAWTGFLLTSINLFPIGQLDGGHILYALLGERANRLARPIAMGVMALSLPSLFDGGLSPSYLFWGALAFFLLSWHPPVPHPEDRLTRGSRAIVIACAILFALTFMPAPMRFVW